MQHGRTTCHLLELFSSPPRAPGAQAGQGATPHQDTREKMCDVLLDCIGGAHGKHGNSEEAFRGPAKASALHTTARLPLALTSSQSHRKHTSGAHGASKTTRRSRATRTRRERVLGGSKRIAIPTQSTHRATGCCTRAPKAQRVGGKTLAIQSDMHPAPVESSKRPQLYTKTRWPDLAIQKLERC